MSQSWADLSGRILPSLTENRRQVRTSFLSGMGEPSTYSSLQLLGSNTTLFTLCGNLFQAGALKAGSTQSFHHNTGRVLNRVERRLISPVQKGD